MDTVSRIYEELFNNKKTILKCAGDLNKRFFKENIQMANKHIRWCSILLTIREMQNKTMRYHFTLITMAVIKKTWTKADKDVEKVETSFASGRNTKQHRPTGIRRFLRKQNLAFCDPETPLQGKCPGKLKTCVHAMFGAALVLISK